MAAKKRKKRRVHSRTKASRNPVARRGSLILLFVVVAIALLFAIYRLLAYTGSLFFSRNPAFELKQIEMTSDGRLSSTQLIEYAGVRPGVNLFEVDFDSVRKHLSEVPLIESVRIQRKLPDTLVVQVAERVAVVQINRRRHGIPFLIDRHGVVMPATRSGQALPMIEGLKLDELRPGRHVDDHGVQCVLEILTVADALGLGSQVRFERFDLRNTEFINARLNDKTSARFPRHSIREKLIRLVRVLQIAREQGRRVKTVDLTPDGRNVPITYY